MWLYSSKIMAAELQLLLIKAHSTAFSMKIILYSLKHLFKKCAIISSYSKLQHFAFALFSGLIFSFLGTPKITIPFSLLLSETLRPAPITLDKVLQIHIETIARYIIKLNIKVNQQNYESNYYL